jgi:hypothetical protein
MVQQLILHWNCNGTSGMSFGLEGSKVGPEYKGKLTITNEGKSFVFGDSPWRKCMDFIIPLAPLYSPHSGFMLRPFN